MALFRTARHSETQWINELRFGVNRTTASSSVDNTHPGLSTSLIPGQPFGMIDIPGMSLLGNSPAFPLGDFSTVYQVQDQLSRTIGRHTLKFGVEFRRLQENGPLDFVVNGLYSFAGPDSLRAAGIQQQPCSRILPSRFASVVRGGQSLQRRF